MGKFMTVSVREPVDYLKNKVYHLSPLSIDSRRRLSKVKLWDILVAAALGLVDA
jgi:hypothetical protein